MGIHGGWVFVNCRNVCFFSFGNIGMEPYTQMPLGIWQIPPVIWQIYIKCKNLEIVINVEMCSMLQLHHSRASSEHRDMYSDKIPGARKTHSALIYINIMLKFFAWATICVTYSLRRQLRRHLRNRL